MINNISELLNGVRFGFTWDVEIEKVAVKTADKSLIQSSTTGVPKDLVPFFFSSALNPGETRFFSVFIGGACQDIPIKRKPDGRHVMSLVGLKNQLSLNQMSIDVDSVWFERVGGDFLVYTKCTNGKSLLPTQLAKPSGNTTRKVNSDARVGQAYFKQEVRKVCGNRCVVTGVVDQKPSILIGSHIKPWRIANDEERLDGNNGLLLAPHIDKLFDAMLISFSQERRILVSDRLSREVIEAWGLDLDRQYELNENQLNYMKFHREIFETKVTNCL
ncbi:HNH endonuclease [Veronia pacifica]|uniref:HNH nuclease domain-containing protein n=1 Tax=Veronia pacifica TaxID=1080227 RepID=A0A1C3EL40_9GAMM|nr:HNH endonuclease [Veronia pacifica]ODA33944.1 hypothetical protein A8L45_07785 [Veronia pacifica]